MFNDINGDCSTLTDENVNITYFFCNPDDSSTEEDIRQEPLVSPALSSKKKIETSQLPIQSNKEQCSASRSLRAPAKTQLPAISPYQNQNNKLYQLNSTQPIKKDVALMNPKRIQAKSAYSQKLDRHQRHRGTQKTSTSCKPQDESYTIPLTHLSPQQCAIIFSCSSSNIANCSDSPELIKPCNLPEKEYFSPFYDTLPQLNAEVLKPLSLTLPCNSVPSIFYWSNFLNYNPSHSRISLQLVIDDLNDTSSSDDEEENSIDNKEAPVNSLSDGTFLKVSTQKMSKVKTPNFVTEEEFKKDMKVIKIFLEVIQQKTLFLLKEHAQNYTTEQTKKIYTALNEPLTCVACSPSWLSF
jgi:hypothetical protein